MALEKKFDWENSHLNKVYNDLLDEPLPGHVKFWLMEEIDFALEIISSGSKDRVNDKTEHGYTALHIAASYGDINAVKTLLTVPGIDVNAQSECGNTPAYALLISGDSNIETLRTLLKDPRTLVNPLNGDSPLLHTATEAGQTDYVAALLAHPKIDVNARNEDGRTALHIAAAEESDEPETYGLVLKAARIDVNARDKDKRTPLHMAVLFGSSVAAKDLLQAGANVKAADKDGKTAYALAAQAHYPNPEIRKILKFAMRQHETSLRACLFSGRPLPRYAEPV